MIATIVSVKRDLKIILEMQQENLNTQRLILCKFK